MPQSLADVLVHIVYSTKQRVRCLEGSGLRSRLYAYLAGICRRRQCCALAAGGTSDHVHLLCQLHRTVALADLLRELKRSSSNWLQSQDVRLRNFAWQAGYGAFSVGCPQAENVAAYIRNQGAQHRQQTFQEEFCLLMTQHKIEFDERYVWD